MKNNHQVELARLCEIMIEQQCTSYLEIGSRYGESINYVAHHVPGLKRMVSVDFPGGLWGDKASQKPLSNVMDAIAKKHGCKTHIMFGDSKASDVIQWVTELGPFDACYIDGDHTLEGVTADWLNYRPLVTKVMAFDDFATEENPYRNGANEQSPFGVAHLWKELSRDYPFEEIIGPRVVKQTWDQGIGVLFI